MKKPASTAEHLKFLARHIAELVYGLESIAVADGPPDAASRLKLIDALLRLKKAMLETRLLEEDLRERLQQRRGEGRKPARKAGISPEALAEIGRLLGLKGEGVGRTTQIDKMGDKARNDVGGTVGDTV